jgi:putative transposase
VPRSSYYYQPRPESAENLRLLRRLDQLYLKRPFFGSRKMAVELEVNRKRIQRLMRILGIEAHYRKPNLSRPATGHQVYPYLLRGVEILRPNHVWSTDVTYLPMHGGFLYLVAVMDWFSRFVLSWERSNTLETSFCLTALDAAFRFGQPEIWNSDQGSQFTSSEFLAPLQKRGILISMDGRGRALDNVFIERLWRSLKYELIYPRRLRHRPRSLPGVAKLFPLLQLSAPAPGVGLSDTGRPVPAEIQKEEVIFLMRALPSCSRDLALLLPEWMLFSLLQMAPCRTLEMLARGTGLRGDETRAPMQVRNGWRPDVLPGYVRRMVAVAGLGHGGSEWGSHHPSAEATSNPEDAVAGTVFEVTERALAAADRYERAGGYRRISVTLRSGSHAWVYVRA